MIFICTRCGEKISGKDAEFKFNIHVCKNKRNFDVWDMELLERVANNEISEAQAWQIHDSK